VVYRLNQKWDFFAIKYCHLFVFKVPNDVLGVDRHCKQNGKFCSLCSQVNFGLLLNLIQIHVFSYVAIVHYVLGNLH
jgi:hypothetical protein